VSDRGEFLLRGLRLAAVFILLAGITSGCTRSQATVEPEGRLDVFNPDALTGTFLPKDWAVEGPDVEGSYLTLVTKDGTPALKIVNGEKSFVAVRRTQAMLLASPFLTWAWNMDPVPGGVHPSRLVIGFHGGNEKSGSWGGQPLTWLGSPLPPHDRALAIIWGESALRRGTLVMPERDPKTGKVKSGPAPRYIARGGRENGGRWWLEYLDLGGLYKRLWPEDDMGRVRIMFIGVAATGGKPPVAAHISKVVISR